MSFPYACVDVIIDAHLFRFTIEPFGTVWVASWSGGPCHEFHCSDDSRTGAVTGLGELLSLRGYAGLFGVPVTE